MNGLWLAIEDLRKDDRLLFVPVLSPCLQLAGEYGNFVMNLFK